MNNANFSQSEYNMSFSLFYRLNDLFNKLNAATLAHDLYLWYNLILILYKEVAPLINEDNRKQYVEQMDQLIPIFVDIKKSIDQTGKFSITAGAYKDLQRLEISLRDVVHKAEIYIKIKGSDVIDWNSLISDNNDA